MLGLALLAAARPTASPGRAATVRGTVFDSLAHAPLAGAAVQLASADPARAFGASVIADARGRFSFADVPDGEYLLGFQHPQLDSLGVELPPRGIQVRRGRSVRADLALPSAQRLRAAICTASGAVGAPVLSGLVRHADGRAPIADAEVIAEWLEVSLARGSAPVTTRPRLAVRTNAQGFFALCGVPSPGMMRVVATTGADSTVVVEVVMSADGYQRRELYVGSATTRFLDAAAPPGDSAPWRIRERRGDGRLTGTVVFGDAAMPLAGAQVRIIDGPHVRASARGEFTLTDVPAGTRMLEVRAVGYYPVRMPVDVVSAGAPVRVAMSRVRSVLDTVLVIAAYPDDKLRSGFADRRRLALGRFMTSDEIARRRPFATTDLFRNMAGVQLERGPDGDLSLYVRGNFADRCLPNIYVNGGQMNNLDAETLDVLLPPDRIAAVEVYSGAMVPAQFQPGLNGCGSIVFWLK